MPGYVVVTMQPDGSFDVMLRVTVVFNTTAGKYVRVWKHVDSD
jgi:hypothetical protein